MRDRCGARIERIRGLVERLDPYSPREVTPATGIPAPVRLTPPRSVVSFAPMNTDAHNPQPPVIIGIAGGTGSGKTTVALRVQEAAPGKTVQIIHHDC